MKDLNTLRCTVKGIGPTHFLFSHAGEVFFGWIDTSSFGVKNREWWFITIGSFSFQKFKYEQFHGAILLRTAQKLPKVHATRVARLSVHYTIHINDEGTFSCHYCRCLFALSSIYESAMKREKLLAPPHPLSLAFWRKPKQITMAFPNVHRLTYLMNALLCVVHLMLWLSFPSFQ